MRHEICYFWKTVKVGRQIIVNSLNGCCNMMAPATFVLPCIKTHTHLGTATHEKEEEGGGGKNVSKKRRRRRRRRRPCLALSSSCSAGDGSALCQGMNLKVVVRTGGGRRRRWWCWWLLEWLRNIKWSGREEGEGGGRNMWENEEVVCSRKSEIFFVSAATAADPICDRERER